MLQGAGQEQRESWEDCGSDSEMPEQRQGREGWPGRRTDMAQDVGSPAADEQQSAARGALPLQLPMPCCCPSLPWTTWLPLQRTLQSRKTTSERVPTAFRAAGRKPIDAPHGLKGILGLVQVMQGLLGQLKPRDKTHVEALLAGR